MMLPLTEPPVCAFTLAPLDSAVALYIIQEADRKSQIGKDERMQRMDEQNISSELNLFI